MKPRNEQSEFGPKNGESAGNLFNKNFSSQPSIGSPLPRVDAHEKVTGNTKYAADYYGREVVWAGVKRAGVPHGLLKNINAQQAKDLRGVICVLTHRMFLELTDKELSERISLSSLTIRSAIAEMRLPLFSLKTERL